MWPPINQITWFIYISTHISQKPGKPSMVLFLHIETSIDSINQDTSLTKTFKLHGPKCLEYCKFRVVNNLLKIV